MFIERMALEVTLRREKLTAESWTYRRLRPYRRAPRWQVWLCSRLGDWLVARGTALQQRYRRAEASLASADYTHHTRMEQTS